MHRSKRRQFPKQPTIPAAVDAPAPGGYLILTCRDQRTGWRNADSRPATLPAAEDLADAIAADTSEGPVMVKVVHPVTGNTVYISGAARLDDVLPTRDARAPSARDEAHGGAPR